MTEETETLDHAAKIAELERQLADALNGAINWRLIAEAAAIAYIASADKADWSDDDLRKARAILEINIVDALVGALPGSILDPLVDPNCPARALLQMANAHAETQRLIRQEVTALTDADGQFASSGHPGVDVVKAGVLGVLLWLSDARENGERKGLPAVQCVREAAEVFGVRQ
jgi:hypothetical protein